MAQGWKSDTPFHEVCARIYEGFGMWAVIDLVQNRQHNGMLQDIAWDECAGCEEITPFEKGNWMMANTKYCLVCGLTHTINEEEK